MVWTYPRRSAKLGAMNFLAGASLLFAAFSTIGIAYYRIWRKSTWRTDQVDAVRRISRLVDRLVLILDEPDSGLTYDDIGDVAADWAPLRAELVHRYSFKSWITSSRKRHTLDDRFAHALWTLADKQIRPLNQHLDTRPDGPLSKSTIKTIFEVLSTDLNEKSSNVVKLATRIPDPQDESQLKLSS